MKKLFIISIIFPVFIFLNTGMAVPESFDEKVAVIAAQQWLKLIDDKMYYESWEESSSIFKDRVGKEQWSRQLSSIRGSFGALIKRELSSTFYTTTLPGAPDGEYVVIEFRAQYENKDRAIETVTPMKEKNGRWRVSGYYIR